MSRPMNRWILAALILGLVSTGCQGEGPSEQDENSQTTAEDRMPPLADLNSLVDGAPHNDELGAEAKADQILPSKFDLVDLQTPVRDQGARGVCSNFSTVGLMEHLYKKEGTIEEPNFSEQFMQWSTKVEIGRFTNTTGSNAQVNLMSISGPGIVEDSVWPYDYYPWGPSDDPECVGDEKDQPLRCLTNGDPTDEMLEAPRYKLPAGRWVSTRTRDLKAFMYNNEQSVIIGGSFYYQSWNHGGSKLPTNSDYWREGYVLYPNAADKEDSQARPAGHSILLVGWDDDLEVPRVDGDGKIMTDESGDPITEKGFFIFKNSWGTGSFGRTNPYGDGYGFISYRYVQEYKTAYGSGEPLPQHFPEIAELVCGTDELVCDEECVTNDEQNCGACGVTCSEGEVCDGTECVVPTCDMDNVDCFDLACLGLPVCRGEEETFIFDEFVAIPDNDLDGVTTSIEVTEGGLIQKLTLGLLIEHSFRGDLSVELVHPSGASTTFVENDGRPGLDIVDEFEIDDFYGLESGGTWKLKVIDHANLDDGEILEWYLSITR